jgi:hypothetical protein
MSVKEAQTVLQRLLQNELIDCNEVRDEWRTEMDRDIYSPRLDIAVGPFATDNGTQLTEEYNDLFETNKDFIKQLAIIHFRNIMPEINGDELIHHLEAKLHFLKFFNPNSRCFITIEIENQVSRKHLLGGAINASALGRIAIAVGFTEEKHRAFLRLIKYYDFLEQVGKPTLPMANLLIISYPQLFDFLNTYEKKDEAETPSSNS